MSDSTEAARSEPSDAFSGTSLGPIATWPPHLRSAFDVCLQSSVPTFVWWGPELSQLYNEAGAPLVRARLFSSPGAPARESWADTWSLISPAVEHVFLSGNAAVARGVPAEPNDGASAAHLDFYCNAIRGDRGSVDGLFAIAVESVHAAPAASRHEKMLDAALRLTGSDFASLQLLDDDREQLLLVAHRGFPADAAAFWDRVDAGSGTACGKALQRKQRVVVPDVEEASFIRDTIDLRIFRDAGIRAVQTTPLVAGDQSLLGMLSTHWRGPYRPKLVELERIDVLAREVAEVLVRET